MAEQVFPPNKGQRPDPEGVGRREAPDPAYGPNHGAANVATTVPHLLRQLLEDVTVLVRKELALASSEIAHSVDEARRGAIGLVGGSAVLYAGGLFLLAAATLGLAEVMPGWAAALIVGGVVSLMGLIMLQVGKNKVRPRHFLPERLGEALRKDKDVIGRQTR